MTFQSCFLLFFFYFCFFYCCEKRQQIKSSHQFSGFYKNFPMCFPPAWRVFVPFALFATREWKITHMRNFLQYFINKLFCLFAQSVESVLRTSGRSSSVFLKTVDVVYINRSVKVQWFHISRMNELRVTFQIT